VPHDVNDLLRRRSPTTRRQHPAGHGINSYGLNIVTQSASGAIAAYMQN